MNFYDKFSNSKLFLYLDILFLVIASNVLWFITSLLGLGILFIFPATIALFIIMKDIKINTSISTVKVFYKILFKEFFKAQKVFGIVLVISFVFYINLSLLNQFPNTQMFLVIELLSYLFLLLFGAAIVHLIPVYIYFPYLSPIKTIKYSFIFSFSFPIQTILLLIIYFIVFLLFFLYSSMAYLLLFLCLISIIALLTIKIIHQKYALFIKDHEPLNIKNYL